MTCQHLESNRQPFDHKLGSLATRTWIPSSRGSKHQVSGSNCKGEGGGLNEGQMQFGVFLMYVEVLTQIPSSTPTNTHFLTSALLLWTTVCLCLWFCSSLKRHRPLKLQIYAALPVRLIVSGRCWDRRANAVGDKHYSRDACQALVLDWCHTVIWMPGWGDSFWWGSHIICDRVLLSPHRGLYHDV